MNRAGRDAIVSIAIGFTAQVVLAIVSLNCPRGSTACDVLRSLFVPGYRAGLFFADFLFPNRSPHTTGGYLSPLIVVGCQLLSFILSSFVVIRLIRIISRTLTF
jgi:hypothetical protein